MENNNDKAKRILFGKDISKMMQDIPCYGVENGEGVEYNFTHENRIKKFSMYDKAAPPSVTSDHTISPPIHNTMDMQNENVKEGTMDLRELSKQWLDPEYLKKRYEKMDEVADFMHYTSDNCDAICKIRDYCHDNNCSPQDLINAHQKSLPKSKG